MLQTRRRATATALVALSLVSPTIQSAEIDWQIKPYLWAADVGLDTTINGDPALGLSVPFKNLIDKLDSALMLYGEGVGSNSNIGGFVDIISLSLSDTSITSVGPGGPILGDLAVVASLEMGLYEAGGILRFGDKGIDKTVMDILIGIRYVDVEQNLVITLPGPAGTVVNRRIKISETDAMIGVRVLADISNRWGYQLRGDYADFGTDGTINLYGGIDYTFGESGLFSMELGYRYFKVDLSGNLSNGARTSSEIDLSGPVLGFAFSF